MTDPITPSAASTPSAAPLSTSSSASSSTSSSSTTSSATTDYDDFLTLLTAQLRNQDPLNPQDSTQFVEQIATFTGVEQQTATNAKLDELIGLQTGGELSTLASWIGATVEAIGAAFDFDGVELSVTQPPNSDATTASVVIRDLDGREVATLPSSASGATVTWDGATSNGGVAPSGLYRIDFVYGDGDDNWSVAASGSGLVVEARIDADGAKLVLDSGAVVSPDDVTSLRAPETAAAGA